MPENPLTVGGLFSGIPSGVGNSALSGPVCELCGIASKTRSASGSLPGIGQVSLVTRTCAPLWPTPSAADRGKGGMQYARGNPTLRGAVLEGRTDHGRCPCRCHTSMSSAAASPAKTSASLAKAPGSGDHARVFGGTLLASLANFDPATSSWRTSQLSLLEDSTPSLGTLPRSGSMRNGTVFQHQPLAPLTAGIGSGLLPTPTASEGTGPGHTAQGGMNLRTVVALGLTKDGLWSTPAADDTGHRKDKYAQGGTALSAQAGGSLNPTWVEWLMGFPLGWTDLEASVTPLSPRSASGSGDVSSSGKPPAPK